MRHAAAPPLPAASAPRGPRCRGCGGRVMAASHAPAVASAAPVSRLLSSVAAADANGEWPGLRVAYQGCPGAYSEQASLLAYRACTPAPFDQFENAFEACEQFLVDRAVLPIENSLGVRTPPRAASRLTPPAPAGLHPPQLRPAAAPPAAHRRRGEPEGCSLPARAAGRHKGGRQARRLPPAGAVAGGRVPDPHGRHQGERRRHGGGGEGHRG